MPAVADGIAPPTFVQRFPYIDQPYRFTKNQQDHLLRTNERLSPNGCNSAFTLWTLSRLLDPNILCSAGLIEVREFMARFVEDVPPLDDMEAAFVDPTQSDSCMEVCCV